MASSPHLAIVVIALSALSCSHAAAPSDASTANRPAEPARGPASGGLPAAATTPPAAQVAESGAAGPMPTASSAPAAATSSVPVSSPPDVTVSNIGMHIGGGPNDEATKEPIRRSVEPHFEEFRTCYATARAGRAVDFGVDLSIGKDGGKATVSHPRTAEAPEFRDCVVRVFEQIEFLKPRGGATVVSYSLRFAPKK